MNKISNLRNLAQMIITAYLLSFTLLSTAAAFAQTSAGDESAASQGPLLGAPVHTFEKETSSTLTPATCKSAESSSQPATALAKESGDLHIFWVPGYIWFSSVSGNVGAGGYSVPINSSFSDIFSNINIGYAGAVDIRHRRLGALLDLEYIKLTTQEQSTPYSLLYSTVRSRNKTLFITPEFYARVFDNKLFSVDALAGVRVWRLDNGLDFGAGRLPAFSVDSTSAWADPLLGARFRANLSRELFLTLLGDAGVGSNRTWQIYAGGGKEFKEKYSVLLGYRHLQSYNKDRVFLFDTSMNGLLLGFGIRFK